MTPRISGQRRLAIFLSVLWVTGWLVAYAFDRSPGPFKLEGFVLIGVAPPVLAWGVCWVWRGFRPRTEL